MADKVIKKRQRNLILVDIKGNAEFIYETMKEIADKLEVPETVCLEAKNNYRKIKNRYMIENYRE